METVLFLTLTFMRRSAKRRCMKSPLNKCVTRPAGMSLQSKWSIVTSVPGLRKSLGARTLHVSRRIEIRGVRLGSDAGDSSGYLTSSPRKAACVEKTRDGERDEYCGGSTNTSVPFPTCLSYQIGDTCRHHKVWSLVIGSPASVLKDLYRCTLKRSARFMRYRTALTSWCTAQNGAGVNPAPPGAQYLLAIRQRR